jgi:glycosyltransferase involved in cell wall biosynthesis
VLSLLARNGYDVEVIHREVWGLRHRLTTRRAALIAARGLAVYVWLFWRLLRVDRPDLILVLYPGHTDMPVVTAVARLRRIPVVFDSLYSLFDTMVHDRALRGPRSTIARIAGSLDRSAFRRANLVLVDTPEDGDYFATLSRLPREGFRTLWVGAPEAVFHPLDDVKPAPRTVLFYGTFIPLQGVDVIVNAARLLADDDIRITIIGEGQMRPTIERQLRELDLANVDLEGNVPLEALPARIASSALCLGIFGTTAKAGRVIPNKLFQCLAVGRPVVTADTPAVRSAFDDEVAVVQPGDPEALAGMIRTLIGDEAQLAALALAGRRRFERDYSEVALGRTLSGYVDELVRDPG